MDPEEQRRICLLRRRLNEMNPAKIGTVAAGYGLNEPGGSGISAARSPTQGLISTREVVIGGL